jgi:hypothetical protein
MQEPTVQEIEAAGKVVDRFVMENRKKIPVLLPKPGTIDRRRGLEKGGGRTYYRYGQWLLDFTNKNKCKAQYAPNGLEILILYLDKTSDGYNVTNMESLIR